MNQLWRNSRVARPLSRLHFLFAATLVLFVNINLNSVCAQYGSHFNQNPYGSSSGQYGSNYNIPPPYSVPNYGDRPVGWFDPSKQRPSLAQSAIYNYNHSDSRCLDALVNSRYEDTVSVNTRYGRVVGKIAYLCDAPGLPERERPFFGPRPKIFLNVTVFLGIPYARPPVGEYRFRTPQPPQTIGGVIDATQYQPVCPQYLDYVGFNKGIPRMDEDCLYLNIFSPFASTPISKLYPVMVYIHGGEYDHGTGNTFPGHMLAASQEVVVVTINYRLGLLGFLATADNSSAGNYGMLDQVRAIEYVRENIRQFNGDPDLITVFGPGAGAASAGLLSLSPLTRRYIKRVIAQSGSAVSEWAIHRDIRVIRNTSIVAGYTYGCRTYHSRSLVECLRSRSATELTVTRVKPDVGWLPWAPVVDAFTREPQLQFLPGSPEALLESKTRPFPPGFAYMTGLTRDEGSASVFFDEELSKNGYFVDQKFFDRKVVEYIKIYNATLNPEALISATKYMYTPWTDPSNETLIRKGLIDMITDSWFVAGADKMAKLMLKNHITTYFYALNYTIEGLDRPEWMGVPHDSEYLFATGAPFMDAKFYPPNLKLERAKWTEADRNMSWFFMKAWANFAREGNPTPQALFNTIIWKPMSLKTLQYLSVNTTNLTSIMHRDYKQKESQFWNQYVPQLVVREPFLSPPYFEPVEEELRIYRATTWAVVSILIILVFLVVLCSCLYCRAKRDRVGDAALDDLDFKDIVAIGTQYSAPSTRANSEASLSMRPIRTEYPQPYNKSTTPIKQTAKYKSSENKGNSHHTYIFGKSMATSAV